jgi:hypothetical protein
VKRKVYAKHGVKIETIYDLCRLIPHLGAENSTEKAFHIMIYAHETDPSISQIVSLLWPQVGDEKAEMTLPVLW